MMIRKPLCVLFLFTLLTAQHNGFAEEKVKPIWLVVTRPMFVEALKPLVDARQQEGFDTRIVTTGVTEAITQSKPRPRYLLLVGDDDPQQTDAPWRIPSKQLDLYRWRSVQRRQFASDAAWADRNNDLVPDFAVGRIPARSVEQVEIAVRKILEFEAQAPTIRDLDLPVWSGSPLYGETIDAMANSLLLSTIQSKSPEWLQPWILMGDPLQPFCGWPNDQPSRFLEQMRNGGLLSVFIGHGEPAGVLAMVHDDKGIFLSIHSDLSALQTSPPTSPMILLTCAAGRFDGDAPSLAETLLFLPGGPVATIAATTESHPLTNYFTGRQMLAVLKGKRRRLGDVWLLAQRRAQKARDYLMEPVLKDVEGKLEENINVDKLRRDQMLMYNLLGDPATALRLPRPLKVNITRDGDGWRWRVDRPERATHLEVACRAFPISLPTSSPPPDDRTTADRALIAANRCFEFETLTTIDGNQPWEGAISKPGTIRFVASDGDFLFVHAERVQSQP